MAVSDWTDKARALFSRKDFNYSALPEDTDLGGNQQRPKITRWDQKHKRAIRLTGAVFTLAVVGLLGATLTRPNKTQSCDYVDSGFQCEPAISHSWGQYSPYYSVPSDISSDIPDGCEVTFAQILSRHGARDPTKGKSLSYAALFDRIHSEVTEYEKGYDFISNYKYSLGADQLTVLGEQELVNSGIKFYKRYEKLARTVSPFVRSAGQKRVVDSAVNWTQGFHEARLKDKNAKFPDAYPYNPVILPEEDWFNNTLSPMTCPAFRSSKEDGGAAQSIWLDIFAPPIADRVNSALPGANLTNYDIVLFMEMCPFETVANADGHLSPFCDLFSTDEWNDFDYYHSLGKWYDYTSGNPLAPTQGVGFVNELIARLTGQPVNDRTSTNTTLDSSRKTFPLDGILYADFSHDNDMAGVFGAMGLYNATEPLSNTTKASPKESNGYAASWAVPFAARMYVEKLSCKGVDEEFVRVLVNDRVIPLQNCGVDELGRCRLSKYVESLSFAREGGNWDLCYN
ncbi:histidine phosphatase superfamily [Xylariaceae sp. FL0594]|nr:histidine phosphatase superfamily [Xylariaceae sp. FL0594]